MVLENCSQNKWRSESNVSKNISKPCESNSSGRRVKKLIQKYEELSVSAKNINLQSAYRHSSCEDYISVKTSEMLSDNISLNRNTVSRFLSLENDNKYVINEYKQNDSKITSDVKDNCDTKMPSHSKKSSKSNYKYVDESDRDRKQSQGSSTSSAKRKEDIWKIFTPFIETDKGKKNDYQRNLSKDTKKETKYSNTDKERQQYSNSLPSNKKKQDNSFGKNFIRSFSSTTSRDKKAKPGSNSNQKDNKVKTIPKDGNTVAKTGAIKKQMNADDIIYRKRRNSYLMATQDEDFRKLKIHPQHPQKQSYVSKTISKFESDIQTVVDVTTRTSYKFEQEIKQLFQQYHDNNKFGTSNKMTREELSLEIDNVLLNKFKQLSRDSSPEESTMASGTNHNHTNQNIAGAPPKPDQETLVIVQQEDTQNQETENIATEYVIIMRDSTTEMSNDDNIGQGQDVVHFDTENGEINIREKLTTELNKVLNGDSINGSVEDLCDDLSKAIRSSLSADVQIKNICVSVESDEDNMFDNIQQTVNTTEHIYENSQYIQEKIHDKQAETNSEEEEVLLRDPHINPKRKVSNLVSYFSDKIAEISTATAVERNTSFSKTQKPSYDDDVFTSPSSEKELHSTVSTLEHQVEAFNPVLSSGSLNTDSSYEDGRNSPDIRVTCIDDELYKVAQNINSSLEESTKQNNQKQNINSPGVRITCLDEELSKLALSKSEDHDSGDVLNNQTPRNSSLYRHKSFNSTTSSDDFEYINLKYQNKYSIHEQINTVHQEQETEESTEHKPRFSRLYSGKFSRHNSVLTKRQDPNNNEQVITTIEANIENGTKSELINDNNITTTENAIELNTDEQIYQKIQDDNRFLSDSDGDYDIKEACNIYNNKFQTLQNSLSTADWVENTVQRIQDFRSKSYDDFDMEEDTEHIYERIKRSGSQGTLCTIYDEQNNPTIRMSMMDITGEYAEVAHHIEEKKIEDAERQLRKNIEDMQDNSKKACLINELITSEKYYINTSLHRIVVDYMPEMNKENIPNYPKGLVGKSRQIFGNADLLYEEHKYKFLPALEKHTTMDELATCFLNHETLFKLYPLYSKNKPKSELIMKDYGAYFKAKQDEINDKLDLPSYLLTPIQRLAKYCLLLRSIVKECEKENNDTAEKIVGLEKLKCALDLVNKQMRMGNDLIALDSIVGYDGNIREHGEVLLRDTFMVQPPSRRGQTSRQAYEGMIFLFQDCLLITAVNRQDYQETFVYKESFQLTDMGYSDIDSEPLEFSVWFRKRDNNNYRFRTKYQDLKQKWVKEIFNLLWKQLEANKRRTKKELEENGVKDTRVPVIRPYSVPNKGKESPSTGYSSKTRKRTLNSSSTDTIWYTK